MAVMKRTMVLIMLVVLVMSNIVLTSSMMNDIDNSISVNEPSTMSRPHFGEDWIEFTIPPPTKIVQNLGSPVEIVCEVMGSQVPTIQWVVGHLPLSEINNFDSNVLSESSSTAIAKVQSIHIIDHMLSEARTYTCVGRTGSRTIYASTIVYPHAELKDLVHIHEKPFMGPTRPRITYFERIHLELTNLNVVLPCKVHARPKAEIVWTTGDGKTVEHNQRFKLLPSGDLLITQIRWEDMGGYVCIARNALGTDSADVFLYPVQRDD